MFVIDVIGDEPYISRKKLKLQKVKDLQNSKKSLPTSSFPLDGWTQVEQKQLEVAIRSIGKGTPERWDRIAECIPSKSKVIF